MQTSIYSLLKFQIKNFKFLKKSKLFQIFEETMFLFLGKLEEFSKNFRLFNLKYKNFGP
jgi:hypothetical protein